jgi:hypothetical protein
VPLREKSPRCRERQKIDSNYHGTATRDHIEEPWFSGRESGGINAGTSGCSIKKSSRSWQSRSVNEVDAFFTTPHLEAKDLQPRMLVTRAGSAPPRIRNGHRIQTDAVCGSLTARRRIASGGALPRQERVR